MTLAVCWLLFPVVLFLLALGCGLLVERFTGRLPGVLVVGVGLAVVVIVGDFLTQADFTSELAMPAVVALAVAGGILSPRRRERRLDGWAVAAALAVFAVFAAPVVLSGEATFAGYLKLNDIVNWAVLTTHLMESGHNLPSAESTHPFDVTVRSFLRDSYPAGSFMPLGVGRALVRQDVAWVIQPYLAFLAATLALPLYWLAGRVIESRPLRALGAFVASQAALLFGFSLWGATKELAAASFIALLAALLFGVLAQSDSSNGREDDRRATAQKSMGAGVMPLAIVTAAIVSVLSVVGGVWLLPILAAAFALAVRRRGFEAAGGEALMFAVAAGFLSLPALLRAAEFLPTANEVLTKGSELGVLLDPLNPLEMFGIWPTGDIRADPAAPALTYVLIAVCAAAAAVGIAFAWARRAWEPLLYLGGLAVGGLFVVALGSPWADAKAFAMAAPAIVFTAFMGGAALLERRRRVLGAVALVLISAGVLWSNALAFSEVDLAPRDRLAELEEVGEMVEDDGLVHATEPEPWSVVYFLKNANEPGVFADLDQFNLQGLLSHQTLVVRRSPLTSRPASPFRLTWRGRYYEVWQQAPAGQTPGLRAHVAVGGGQPASEAPCPEVTGIADSGEAGQSLATVRRPPTLLFDFARSTHPESWTGPDRALLYPDGDGTANLRVSVPAAGRYAVWLGGSFRGRIELSVDGKRVQSARGELNQFHNNSYMQMGELDLGAGEHALALRYDGGGLRPGSAGEGVMKADLGEQMAIGPLALTRVPPYSGVQLVPLADARSLCGQSLDWVELVQG
jgi:hypothetical protein